MKRTAREAGLPTESEDGTLKHSSTAVGSEAPASAEPFAAYLPPDASANPFYMPNVDERKAAELLAGVPLVTITQLNILSSI